MRRMLTAATLWIVVLAAPGTARAGLEPGTVAPDFEGKEFVNSEAVSLKRLRGRVILYEVFRTW